MRKLTLLFTILILGLSLTAVFAGEGKPRVILLISEQNIEGPRDAWWASEVDLSATEATIAAKIIEAGYEVVEPQELENTIKKNRAFRMLDLSEKDSIKMGSLSKADYIILAKAVASSGGTVPQSNMRSCFANLTAKLIRVEDNQVITYLDATGNSVHMDVITGGKEALVNAATNLSQKIINALNKERGLSKESALKPEGIGAAEKAGM
jgi:predicted ATP-grasp superfamily ATP-dependent carboligase